jgi:hypothetical protein
MALRNPASSNSGEIGRSETATGAARETITSGNGSGSGRAGRTRTTDGRGRMIDAPPALRG